MDGLIADSASRCMVQLCALVVLLTVAWLSSFFEFDAWADYGLKGVGFVALCVAVHMGVALWPNSKAPLPQAESEAPGPEAESEVLALRAEVAMLRGEVEALRSRLEG